MEGRHQLPFARERNQPDGGSIGDESGPLDAAGLPGAQHRRIDGVGGHRALPVGLRSTGEDGRRDDPIELSGRLCPCGEVVSRIERRVPRPHTHDRHVAGGERAGLVRADDRRRPERLDGGQAAYECVTSGHAPQSDGEGDRGHGRQAFRHGGHGEGDRGLEHDREWRALQDAERADGGGDGQRHPDQAVTERVEAPLQRRALLADTADQHSNPAELGQPARCGDHGPCGAGGHGRALVDHVAAVGERRLGREDEVGLLRHGERFAGQRRFVRPQIGRDHEPAIGGHRLSRSELDDVSGDELLRVHALRSSIAQHERAHDVHGEQRLHGAARPQLHHEAQRGIDDEHARNGRRLDQVAEGERDESRGEQQQDDDAPQLVEEDRECRGRRGWVHAIRSHLVQTPGRLRLVEPAGTRVETEEDTRDVLCEGLASRVRDSVIGQHVHSRPVGCGAQSHAAGRRSCAAHCARRAV